MNDEFPHITVQYVLLERNIGFTFNIENFKNAGFKDMPDEEKCELIKLRRVYHFNKDTSDHVIFTIPEPIFVLVDKETYCNNGYSYLNDQCVKEDNSESIEDTDVKRKDLKRKLHSSSVAKDEIIIERVSVLLPKKNDKLQKLITNLETLCSSRRNEETDKTICLNANTVLGSNMDLPNSTSHENVQNKNEREELSTSHDRISDTNNNYEERITSDGSISNSKENNIEEVVLNNSITNSEQTVVDTRENNTTKNTLFFDELDFNEIIIDDTKVTCEDVLEENIADFCESNSTSLQCIFESKNSKHLQPFENSVFEEHSYIARTSIVEISGADDQVNKNTSIDLSKNVSLELPERSKLQEMIVGEIQDDKIENTIQEDIKPNFNYEGIDVSFVDVSRNKENDSLSLNVNLSDDDVDDEEPCVKRLKIDKCDFVGFSKEEINSNLGQAVWFCKIIITLCKIIQANIKKKEDTEKDLHKCTVCNFKVQKLNHLQIHLRSHIEPYWCEMCLDVFSNATELESHVKRSHDTGEKPDKSVKKVKSLGSLPSGEKLYKCGYCNYSSSYVTRLTSHMKVHEKEKLYYCNQCNFITLKESLLQSHIDSYHDMEEYECSECGFMTMYGYELTIHMQIHEENKRFKCAVCSFRTSHLGYFNAHIRYHQLKSESNLEIVGNTKNIKLYQCKKCNYSSKHQRAFYKHYEKQHGSSKAEGSLLIIPRNVMCTMCDLRTETPEALLEHMITHKSMTHKCGVCDYVTNSIRNLRNHNKKHSEQAYYRCPICNCKFLTLNEFQSHIRGCFKSTKTKLYNVGANT